MKRGLYTLTFIMLIFLVACKIETKFEVKFFVDGTLYKEVQVIENSIAHNYNDEYIPIKEGYIFEGWFYNESFTMSYQPNQAIKENINLYAKMSAETFTVFFETNEGNDIQDITVLYNRNIELPIPIKANYLFMGWFIDPDFNVLFDENTPIKNDIKLYAKWVIKHDLGEVEYAIENTSLTFTAIDGALIYHVYIGDASNPILINEPIIDLLPYESQLLNKTNVEVYAEFSEGENLKLFDVDLQFISNSLKYETGFEEAEFVASTTYNNATPKVTGPINQSWEYVSGSVSSTQPIDGTKSFQLRFYNNPTIRYLEMKFEIVNMSKVTFVSKSQYHDLLVKYYVDGVLSQTQFTITLDNTNKEHTININEEGRIRLRFEILPRSSQTSTQVYFDNLKMYTNEEGRSLVIHPKLIYDDYPETDEAKLLTLKNRFQSDRNSLGAPMYSNALSQAGLIQYYATLNGLTGQQFKTELEKIISSTHMRFISYGEARFVLEKSDLVDENGKQYLDGLYAKTKIVKYWDGGETWSREHVWPNSRLGIPRVDNNTKNQGSDVHNLRAINPSVNSTRSNRYFVRGSGENQTIGSNGYYPGDEYKGDVARILFYMVVRYPNILSLVETDIDRGTTYDQSSAVMGVLSVLLEWHKEDPVSDFERNRNNVIYSYQGNRNPFIDHPEYVDLYFS
ncbi:endonuclease [Acholeplasma hippikon]|uniref:Extracellular ribonuclease n=1 Tax=Acholeplasma hippikon TaxID=264636 RepID=A0A449BKH8_9MOLU|nr:endonuclease [Acholeplasma hippikon]VEU82948.1 Extracellular ribonuclease precursor [Acholeplasma hippikon]